MWAAYRERGPINMLRYTQIGHGGTHVHVDVYTFDCCCALWWSDEQGRIERGLRGENEIVSRRPM